MKNPRIYKNSLGTFPKPDRRTSFPSRPAVHATWTDAGVEFPLVAIENEAEFALLTELVAPPPPSSAAPPAFSRILASVQPAVHPPALPGEFASDCSDRADDVPPEIARVSKALQFPAALSVA